MRHINYFGDRLTNPCSDIDMGMVAAVIVRRLFILSMTAMLTACMTSNWPQDYYAHRNTGDRIVQQIKPGMTVDEIHTFLMTSEFKDFVTEDALSSLQSESFNGSQLERDHLTRELAVCTQYKVYHYWITDNTQVTLTLYFDADQRYRTAINYPSWVTLERYWHEKITSQLKIKSATPGMTREQVHALIGSPQEIIDLEEEVLPAHHGNHYWSQFPNDFVPPTSKGQIKRLEVYSYPIGGGIQRRVYIGYREISKNHRLLDRSTNQYVTVPDPKYPGPQKDELEVIGYDHAAEEAERYLRENNGTKD